MRAALAAAAAATVAIALFLRARRLRTKKIAYINTEDAPKWHDQLEVFAAALRLPPEVFEKFDAFADQFPSAAALQRGEYSGVLITGSHFSAVDPTLPWLNGLFASIRAAAAAVPVPDGVDAFGVSRAFKMTDPISDAQVQLAVEALAESGAQAEAGVRAALEAAIAPVGGTLDDSALAVTPAAVNRSAVKTGHSSCRTSLGSLREASKAWSCVASLRGAFKSVCRSGLDCRTCASGNPLPCVLTASGFKTRCKQVNVATIGRGGMESYPSSSSSGGSNAGGFTLSNSEADNARRVGSSV